MAYAPPPFANARARGISFSLFNPPPDDDEKRTGVSIMVACCPSDTDFAKKFGDLLRKENDNQERILRRNVVLFAERPENESPDTLPAAMISAIEESDCFLCCVSPDALENKKWNTEVDLAFKYGKRILPVVCAEVDFGEVRQDIANLTSHFFQEDDDWNGSFKILNKAMDKDWNHAAIHTKVLCAALSWERQNRDVNLLLAGEDIKEAQQFLCASSFGLEPHPTKLHLEFIDESSSNSKVPCPFHENPFYLDRLQPDSGSLFSRSSESKLFRKEQQPNVTGCSVYLCFEEGDVDTARRVAESFGNGRQVVADWENTAPCESWLEMAHAQVEKADVFLALLSPAALKSEKWNWELDHAATHGKRIIPLVVRDIDFREVRAELAESASYYFFREDDDFDTAIGLLANTIDYDSSHVIMHTQILVAAVAWEKADFANDKLLSGDDLKTAQGWMRDAALGKEPHPRTLHLDFITAGLLYSRRGAAQKVAAREATETAKREREHAKQEQKERARQDMLDKQKQKENAQAREKADKYHKRGLALLQQHDYFGATSYFTRALELVPDNPIYKEANQLALAKSKTHFLGTVEGLLLPDYRFANPESATDTRRKNAVIELAEDGIRVQVSITKGILMKKVIVEKQFSYGEQIQIWKSKSDGSIHVDITGSQHKRSEQKSNVRLSIPNPGTGDDFGAQISKIVSANFEKYKARLGSKGSDSHLSQSSAASTSEASASAAAAGAAIPRSRTEESSTERRDNGGAKKDVTELSLHSIAL